MQGRGGEGKEIALVSQKSTLTCWHVRVCMCGCAPVCQLTFFCSSLQSHLSLFLHPGFFLE
jgi:hypothetical protein